MAQKQMAQKLTPKQLDDLVIQNHWDRAIEELDKLDSENVTRLVISTVFSFERTADDKDWETFLEFLEERKRVREEPPKRNRPYPTTRIPSWCCMPNDEHEVAGGCWSLLLNQVHDRGTCDGCEYIQRKEDDTAD